MNGNDIEDPSHPESRILIVDDDIASSTLIQTVLQVGGYQNTKVLNDSRSILSTFIEFEPDLIVLDLLMPHLDGFQVLNLLRRATLSSTGVPIVVVSSIGESESRYQALRGGAIDVFPKPFEAREFLLRISNLLRLRMSYRQIQEERSTLENEIRVRTEELEDYQLELKQAHLEVIERLARAAEHRDDDTGQHTQRVGLACSMIADTMGLPDEKVEMILRSAPLHDVGKIGVPDAILLKPAPLTPVEFGIMQRHCLIGADLLSGGHSDLVRSAERIALCHHERWDGTGYPNSLSQDEICIEGRVIAVADVFDALTHERPYKEAWPLPKALKEIESQRGRHFDPDVVDAFMTLPHADLL